MYIKKYILGISIVFTLLACKNNTNTSDTEVITHIKENIPFTQEGMLTITSKLTDSVLTTLDIEIADDNYQIETGLMYRNTLGNTQGMLFIFPNEDYRSFYMKNTRIPLDIIYINNDKKIVSVQKNAEPFNEKGLPSNTPAKYVLEVNAGLYDTWGLSVNDVINFVRFKDEQHKK